MDELIRNEPKGYYFEAYSEVESHMAMIRDYNRTIAYKNAIEKNPHLFKDKVVLDVGCGLGILSLFAAKAGAKLVIGVDASNLCDQAKKIVKDNKFDEVIHIVHSKIECLSELPLSIEKVDVIISEWMGLCLYHKSMLVTVIYARDKWLKKDGLIFPDRYRLYLAASDDEELKTDIKNWDRACTGFNMQPMKERRYGEALCLKVGKNKIVTNFCLINELNLYEASADYSFSAKYSLIAERDGCIVAFFTYFDAIFSEGREIITLTTSPLAPATHWGQTAFRFRDSMSVNKDEKITGEFSLKPFEHNFRDLSFGVDVQALTSNIFYDFSSTYVLR